jgi:hypothetical protein
MNIPDLFGLVQVAGRRKPMSAQPIVHIEIVSRDPRASGDFYKEVFGWKIEVDEKFDYVQFSADPGTGGAFPAADEQQGMKPGDVILYIGVEDIEATLARIEACGGKTLLPRTEIPGIGWFAIFNDPTGNRLALYKSIRS